MKKESATLVAFMILLVVGCLYLVAHGETWALWFIVGTLFGAGIAAFCYWLRTVPKGIPKEDESIMFRHSREAVGAIATPIANASSILLLVAYGVLFAAPDQAKQVVVPWFNVNLHFFVDAWLPVLFYVWGGSNLLSARWAPEKGIRTDRATSGIAFWGIAAIVAYNLVTGQVAAVEASLYSWFGIIPIGAFLDWWFAKVKQLLRSSTLNDENKKLNDLTEELTRQLAAAKGEITRLSGLVPAAEPPRSGVGPFFEVARRLGVSPLKRLRFAIPPDKNPVLVLMENGEVDMDANLSKEEDVRAILEGTPAP